MSAPPAGDRVDPERVAAVICRTTTVGGACKALAEAGWESSLAGNRITVEDRVFARYIGRERWIVDGPDDCRLCTAAFAGSTRVI